MIWWTVKDLNTLSNVFPMVLDELLVYYMSQHKLRMFQYPKMFYFCDIWDKIHDFGIKNDSINPEKIFSHS